MISEQYKISKDNADDLNDGSYKLAIQLKLMKRTTTVINKSIKSLTTTQNNSTAVKSVMSENTADYNHITKRDTILRSDVLKSSNTKI